MAGTARAKCFVSIIPKGEARDLKAAATTEPEEIQALRAEVAARARPRLILRKFSARGRIVSRR